MSERRAAGTAVIENRQLRLELDAKDVTWQVIEEMWRDQFDCTRNSGAMV